jgi:ubiquinone biosynthesis protein UbiJ
MQGEKPAVQIAGDVQLAADVSWLAEHLRWDIEEDLSRVLGDAPAHGLVQAAQTFASALRQFVGKRSSGGATGPVA